MHQLSDVIKTIEDKGLIESVEICGNYDTGETELHIWFYNPDEVYKIITEAKVSGIKESDSSPYWE